MNSFTSPEPSFAYQSAEASRKLGIPDAPEIHLAITDLGENLLRIAEMSFADADKQRAVALRTASGAVLFWWPLALAECELRLKLDLPQEDSRERGANWITNDKDWLSEAVARLREEGFAIRNDF